MDGNEEQRSGRSYLVEGRRVRLADLLKEGLLSPGEELVFERPRLGETHHATVTVAGRLRLLDGQEFSTPSSAAQAATGTRALDGWTAWAVAGSGNLLDTLRQRFLDAVSAATPAEDATETSPTGTTARERHQLLKDVREKAERGTAHRMTVQDLIRWWDADSRSSAVDARIAADLANHGLGTVPDFRKVGLDTEIDLLVAAERGEVASTLAPVSDDEEDAVVSGLAVGNLPSALGGIEYVAPESTLDVAITKMLLDDYSQLAVISGRSLNGAVSWRSIAQARHVNPSAALRDATFHVDPVSYDADLVDILDRLYQEDFVLVQGPRREIAGIVTTADMVLAYGDLSLPFLLLGQIDSLLRRLVASEFSLDEVMAVRDPGGSRPLTSFDQLTVGDYKNTLGSSENWQRLRWPIDRKTFIKRLDEIRELRNDIMHFNRADPLTNEDVAKLRHFMRFLRTYVT